MKKCPYCAEEIQDKAIKCKHCMSELIPEEEAPSKPNQGKLEKGLEKISTGKKNFNLSSRQRFIVVAGILIMAAMILYPPWMYNEGAPKYPKYQDAGYHFIFRQPTEIIIKEAMRGETPQRPSSGKMTAEDIIDAARGIKHQPANCEINFKVLLLQELFVALVALALFFAFSDKNKPIPRELEKGLDNKPNERRTQNNSI